MTYNVFGGTLNPTLLYSTTTLLHKVNGHMVGHNLHSPGVNKLLFK